MDKNSIAVEDIDDKGVITDDDGVGESDVELSNKIQESCGVVNGLFDKYSNDSYMIRKTHHYINKLLPNILENIRLTHEQNVSRIESLTIEQENFIESFLNTNRYFYVPTTKMFFFYDGLNYRVYNEDDILYNVLSTISRDKHLLSWKQRTKVYVMKQIKDKNVLESIPEPETIQFVLNYLYPSIFSSKLEAKYFLTILGDNILKKNNHFIHFINPKAKHFIKEIDAICKDIIGANLSQTFKYKYHEQHNYQDCRLVKISDCIDSDNVWINIINNCALDIICVAAHYSDRFNNSDDFILYRSNDIDLKNYVFYLKNTNPDQIVDCFVEEYIQNTNGPSRNTQLILDNQNSLLRTTQITWKNMQYLWKQFLDYKNLPSIMFQQTFKYLLVHRLETFYNEECDSFIGICSKFLPDIQKFLQFWSDTIVIDDNESDFEIEELTFFFRKWCETHNETVSTLKDKQILDLISYYYPDIEIEKDKFINNICCSLWDKHVDIQTAMELYKEDMRKKIFFAHGGIGNHEMVESPIMNRNISKYDLYLHYSKYIGGMSDKLKVNKDYFIKYIDETLTEYIIDSKFITAQWIIE